MSEGLVETGFDAIRVAGELQRRVGVRTARDEPLARHTTMRVGGPADLFVEARNAFELRALVRFARTRGLPHFVLGRGSNVVVSDTGLRGLTIHCRAQGFEIERDGLVAEAGLPMAKAAAETQRAGLSGLEFGLAIPGCVGGAIWANAGAHDSDLAAVLDWADLLLADGSEARLGATELGLGYRDSRLKHAPPGDPPEVVVRARFGLAVDEPSRVAERLDAIRHWRQAHQPLGIPSAGSVFRNPPGGGSAGALVERAGLKGRRIGGAVVSEKHANWILNDRRGSAADVWRLAHEVRADVASRLGVDLVFEIEFVGDWSALPPRARGNV